MSNQSLLLNPDDAAERIGLGITARTLAGWRFKGLGPQYVKLGHRVGYKPADIDTFIAERTRETEAAR